MKTEEIGKKAALLSLIEMGLGSFMHALHLPLAGHFLSLNQGFILTRASRALKDATSPALISTTAALMKSLSPAGKKLTPMLAIAMQGQLFSLGVRIFGVNFFGHCLAMSLLCLWGILQPVMVYYVLYGETLGKLFNFYAEQLAQFTSPDHLIRALLILVSLKLFIGVLVVWLAYRVSDQTLARYEAWARSQKTQPRKPVRSAYWGALKDLTHPFFLLSWALTLFFYFQSQSTLSETWWILLRPLAVGYLLFLAMRLMPLEKWAKRFESSNPLLSESLKFALRAVGKDG